MLNFGFKRRRNSLPSMFLIGKYPFYGENGAFPDGEATELEAEQWAVTGAVNLPEVLFSTLGEGIFFDATGSPLPVMEWQWIDWVAANGQPKHLWLYRHWLYVYDPSTITDEVANKCSAITKSGVTFP